MLTAPTEMQAPKFMLLTVLDGLPYAVPDRGGCLGDGVSHSKKALKFLAKGVSKNLAKSMSRPPCTNVLAVSPLFLPANGAIPAVKRE